ncbi:hypothetical protein F0L17_09460 [Streptomyces sp. TRM43335]|uniref:Uncharacterized protein n=1 Tax=Streptomyces taklimakanensis TaxID=2569853 RepID=A0A6G2BAR6_9ACTN|nr:hypothetical protein [Streptomyces taklimakanensis]
MAGAETFDRLARRIATEYPAFDRPFAESIAGQTVAFLVASAHADEPPAPSKPVDLGWHEFITDTRAYIEFSDRIAGRYPHHVPEPLDEAEHGDAQAARARTVAAIEAAGFAVDAELWPDVADCSQCHAGCHNSPKTKAA